MGKTYKDQPVVRKDREETRKRKIKTNSRSKIKQKIRHDTHSIDEGWDDYDDWEEMDDY